MAYAAPRAEPLGPVLDGVWAIRPGALVALQDLVALGGAVTARGARAPSGPARRPGGGVAVLPVHGVISQRPDLLAWLGGGTNTEEVTRALRLALADPDVRAIILDVDSPGGSIHGVEELAAEIRAARGRVPIVAVANSQAASAAYWIASAADELVVTPSGEVGSIGVVAVHADISCLQRQLGVATTLIVAGKYKGEGNPYEPLGDAARQALQTRVDAYYGAFVRDVAQGRHSTVGAVRQGFGQGRMVGAHAAVHQGMADRVETLDQAIARLQHPSASPRGGTGARATRVAALHSLELRQRRLHLRARVAMGSR